MTTFRAFPQVLQDRADDPATGARVAIESDDACWTYADIADRVGRVAALLRAQGLRPGDRVALLSERHLQAVAGLFGVMAAGGVVCPVEPRLGVEDLAGRLASVSIDWVLADDDLAPKARDLGRPHVVLLARADGLAASAPVASAAGDGALMLFTSGSTGAPKAVLLSHGNLMAGAEGVAGRTGVTPDDRFLHAMPLFHTNGVNNQLIVPFIRGATVSFIPRFRAETFFDEMLRWQPTLITGVPTMYSRLLPFTPPPAALARLRFARCGAAPLSAELHRQIEQHLGVPLVVSYGLSEATCTSAMNPPGACRFGTVGPALDGQRIAILQPGGTQELPAGAEGEICIAGAAVMTGYLPAQPAGDGPGLQAGWLRTGDLGRLDADGYLSITGRLKDIIIRGGENLSPGLIESALGAHVAVQACSVVGAPDADLGEVPVAFVVLREGHLLDEQAMQAEVAQRLSRIHVPARIVGMACLPENAIGKVDRKALKTLAAS